MFKQIKKVVLIPGLMVAAMCATNAQAQEFKPYLGAGVGMFTTDFGVGGFKASNAFGFYVNGGVDFNPYVGAELRLGSVASKGISNSNVGAKVQTDYFLSYLAKLQFPVTDELTLYGLVGASTIKATVSNSFQPKASQTNTKFTYGAGLNYEVADHVRVGAEYVAYNPNADVVGNTIYAATLTSFAINASMSF